MIFHCTREGLGDNISKSAFSVDNGKQQPNDCYSTFHLNVTSNLHLLWFGQFHLHWVKT